MTDVNERIAALEARISANSNAIKILSETVLRSMDGVEAHRESLNDVWKYINLAEERFKVLEKHDPCYKSMIEGLRRSVDVHTEQIERLYSQLMRLDDVYYKVFPERLAGDVRFSKQLQSLDLKHSSDAGPKKA